MTPELSRRGYVLGAVTTGLAGMAGCLDRLPFLGDEPLEFESRPGSVPQSTLDDTGYQERAVHAVTADRTFEIAGQSQNVIVTNWQSEYDRAINLGGLGLGDDICGAMFTVLTTPRVQVLGREFNPVADMSTEELATLVQDSYDEIDDLEQVGSRTMTILGAMTTVDEFEGQATLIEAAIGVDLTVEISEAVVSGEDLVVCVAAYPKPLRNQESANSQQLMEAVEHEG